MLGADGIEGLTCRCPKRSASLPRLVFGVAGVEWAHRDQAQPEVADLGQQPVPCGLIGKQGNDDRLRAVAAELEAAEPVRPLVVEDAVDADLVAGGPPRAPHVCPPSPLAASTCTCAAKARRRSGGLRRCPLSWSSRGLGSCWH